MLVTTSNWPPNDPGRTVSGQYTVRTMYDAGRTSAMAIGAKPASHTIRRLGTCRENIATTNAATTAQIARLLTYAGHRSAPAASGRARHTAAIRYGSTMQKTAKVASSQAPIRATESKGRLNAIKNATASATAWTALTVSSNRPADDCQYVQGWAPSVIAVLNRVEPRSTSMVIGRPISTFASITIQSRSRIERPLHATTR